LNSRCSNVLRSDRPGCGIGKWSRKAGLSEEQRLAVADHVVTAVGVGWQEREDWRRLSRNEMPDGAGHDRRLAYAGEFQDGNARDLRVGNRLGNAALVRIELDLTRSAAAPRGSRATSSIHFESDSGPFGRTCAMRAV
jgi:hypothetical protein